MVSYYYHRKGRKKKKAPFAGVSLDTLPPCYYCGIPAGTVDHTLAQSILFRLREFPEAIDKLAAHMSRLTVPACRECNSTLGAKTFETLAKRKAYIKETYRRKYASLLNAPTWHEEEIDELGPTLAKFIRHGEDKRWLAQRRIRW